MHWKGRKETMHWEKKKTGIKFRKQRFMPITVKELGDVEGFDKR